MLCLQQKVLRCSARTQQQAANPVSVAPTATQHRARPVAARMAPPESGATVADVIIETPDVAVVEQLLQSLPTLPEPGSPEFEFSSDNFLHRFDMSEVLGEGTFGSVRRCVDTSTDHPYAVKVIPKRSTDGKDRAAFIAREVRMWRTLAALSPRIVDLVGAYQDKSNIYLVQELLLDDLQKLLDEQGVLTEYAAATAMQCVLEALTALHEANIVYGDVKPSNFVLTKHFPSIRHQLNGSLPKGDLDVKMIDFGTAQLCKDGCSVAEGISGTPVFLAPEVTIQHRCSISMDVWAAGAMLYLMLTGQFPLWNIPAKDFKLRSIKEAVRIIQAGDVFWDIPQVLDLSPGCQDLLRRMLTADPAKRCSVQEALQHPWLQEQLATGPQ